MEWEVWLSDGTTRTSQDCAWLDLPDGICVVKVWAPDGSVQAMNWDDGVYGDPSTWKQGALIDNHDWKRLFRDAQAQTIAPSKR